MSAGSSTVRIAVLEGDETGQELLEQALRVLDSEVLGVELDLRRFDLSLESRRATSNGVVSEAAAAMREGGLGLKAATITPEGADDVGSPNRILREEVDGKVIVRTGRRLPGVAPIAGVHYPISVVRMAVDDAYGAEESREGDPGGADEVAYRRERITRSTCRAVAEYSFRTAAKLGARVYGGPKWTVSPVYEGMLKEELDAAAERHPETEYRPVLIDATYAGLLSGATDAPLVIPALNRDGDCLSDLVLPMFGSIAGAESVLLAFDDGYDTRVAMAEAPARDGARPARQGRGQPAGDDPRLRRAAAPRRRPVRERLRAGRACDLRGSAGDRGRGRPDARSGRQRRHHRVHRRRRGPGSHQARGVVLVGLLSEWAEGRAGRVGPNLQDLAHTRATTPDGVWIRPLWDLFRPAPHLLSRTYVPVFSQTVARPPEPRRRHSR